LVSYPKKKTETLSATFFPEEGKIIKKTLAEEQSNKKSSQIHQKSRRIMRKSELSNAKAMIYIFIHL
jgi:hypothetical protein